MGLYLFSERRKRLVLISAALRAALALAQDINDRYRRKLESESKRKRRGGERSEEEEDGSENKREIEGGEGTLRVLIRLLKASMVGGKELTAELIGPAMALLALLPIELIERVKGKEIDINGDGQQEVAKIDSKTDSKTAISEEMKLDDNTRQTQITDLKSSEKIEFEIVCDLLNVDAAALVVGLARTIHSLGHVGAVAGGTGPAARERELSFWFLVSCLVGGNGGNNVGRPLFLARPDPVSPLITALCAIANSGEVEARVMFRCTHGLNLALGLARDEPRRLQALLLRSFPQLMELLAMVARLQPSPASLHSKENNKDKITNSIDMGSCHYGLSLSNHEASLSIPAVAVDRWFGRTITALVLLFDKILAIVSLYSMLFFLFFCILFLISYKTFFCLFQAPDLVSDARFDDCFDLILSADPTLQYLGLGLLMRRLQLDNTNSINNAVTINSSGSGSMAGSNAGGRSGASVAGSDASTSRKLKSATISNANSNNNSSNNLLAASGSNSTKNAAPAGNSKLKGSNSMRVGRDRSSGSFSGIESLQAEKKKPNNPSNNGAPTNISNNKSARSWLEEVLRRGALRPLSWLLVHRSPQIRARATASLEAILVYLRGVVQWIPKEDADGSKDTKLGLHGCIFVDEARSVELVIAAIEQGAVPVWAALSAGMPIQSVARSAKPAPTKKTLKSSMSAETLGFFPEVPCRAVCEALLEYTAQVLCVSSLAVHRITAALIHSQQILLRLQVVAGLCYLTNRLKSLRSVLWMAPVSSHSNAANSMGKKKKDEVEIPQLVSSDAIGGSVARALMQSLLKDSNDFISFLRILCSFIMKQIQISELSAARPPLTLKSSPEYSKKVSVLAKFDGKLIKMQSADLGLIDFHSRSLLEHVSRASPTSPAVLVGSYSTWQEVSILYNLFQLFHTNLICYLLLLHFLHRFFLTSHLPHY